jgi:putative NIF3 family GTP cyclohydrolase 1 type 2
MEGRGVSTDEIMETALGLVDATTIPADSAIYVPGAGLKRIMLGVDVGAAELLLARDLGCDAAVAHHPVGGSAVLDFPRVLVRGVELMTESGVPEEMARQTIQPAIARAMLRAQAANHDHAPSIARLLRMPFMNVHLPLDEYGRRVMNQAVAQHFTTLDREPLVGDVVAALQTIPEIRDAPTRVMVPVGRLDNPAGRAAVYHGAGTNGGFAVAQTLFAHGVGTVVYIHLAPEDAERLRSLPAPSGNVVVSGHIASDLIGINRLVRELEQRGVEVVKMSGVA